MIMAQKHRVLPAADILGNLCAGPFLAREFQPGFHKLRKRHGIRVQVVTGDSESYAHHVIRLVVAKRGRRNGLVEEPKKED